MEMEQVSLRIGHGIQNHGTITINVRRIGGTVMVGMLDVMGADREPALREFHGVFHFGGAADGASPDGADGAAHLEAGVPGLGMHFRLLSSTGKGSCRNWQSDARDQWKPS